MTNENLRLQWQERVIQYQESGQSMKKWCEANNQKLHQLQYWLKKFENTVDENNDNSKWLSINLDSTTTDPIHQETIKILVGKCKIEVKPGFNDSVLKDIVKVLSELC